MAFDGLKFEYSADVFATNNAEMDTEHEGLFTAINTLNGDRSVANYEALAGLVIKHFADEEAGNSLSEEHLAMHKDLLKTATDVLGKLKDGSATVDDALIDFLQKWLMNHIKG
eukprot:533625_1